MVTDIRPLHLRCLLAVMLVLASMAISANELSATVDRNDISVNETFQLTLRYNGKTLNEPDLSSLEKDFEVLQQSQSSQFYFSNGKQDSHTLWTLQLLPRRSGKLLIPSFNFNGAVSNAIELDVSDAQPQASKDQLLFLETELDKDSVYVQEQLILSIRLYTQVNLNGLSSDDLQVENATLLKLSNNQYQKSIDGIPHLVVETRYALFPQNSGSLEIPAIRFSASLPDRRDPFANNFLSRGGRKVYLRSEQKTVAVSPRPAKVTMAEWLPSKGVTLSEKWSRPPLDQLRVGEPITRTITVVAQGLTGAQLPPLQLQNGNGYRVYPDQPQMSENTDRDGVLGRRSESLAIVPDQAGEIHLPEVTVNWWNTTTDRPEQTTLEAKTLRVLPASNTASAPVSPSSNMGAINMGENAAAIAPPDSTSSKSNNAVLYALMALNLVLLLIIFWLIIESRRLRRSGQSTPSQQNQTQLELFARLQQTAVTNPFDSDQFQRQLIRWARSFWPEQKINTVLQIAEITGSGTIRKALQAMDKERYGHSADTDLQTHAQSIISQLKEQIAARKVEDKNSTSNNLKTLYKT